MESVFEWIIIVIFLLPIVMIPTILLTVLSVEWEKVPTYNPPY